MPYQVIIANFFSTEDTIPKKVVCHFSGKTYADEERWDIDSCTHCYCLQGQTLCSTVSCPPLPCVEPINVEGSCCPMCPGNKTIVLNFTSYTVVRGCNQAQIIGLDLNVDSH